jgi:glycosyltransferase involved in cell wall biosynthesis/peptidoglycan/xylan/chitin deacetylase (PgdA/CDA1 family)
MLRNRHRAYYALKPYIPWRLRIGLRRLVARRIRTAQRASWPIMPAAAEKPAAWPGWPEGKRFAVVLTHDVESAAGYNKSEKLLRLEQKLGFRSSFNLIPEADYRITPEFRTTLEASGHEVGVHDLRHDGKLFHSWTAFERNAQSINKYLREWGCSGYRSGFMLRNLDWLQALDIQYDSSTFDTDPFELQPDGAGTIFPFWVPSAPVHHSRREDERLRPVERGGYVELPYTLPQDSTLFLILREKTLDIWKTKASWIAENGGMLLLNVHPDYIQFEDEPASPRTYPVALYAEFLNFLRDRFSGAYWQPLPRDVAAFTAGMAARPTKRPQKRVCMITHSFYESDNRVTRYAEALAGRGDHVDVLALRRSAALPKHEVIQGVHVHRLQDRFGKTERTRFSYLWPTVRFLGLSSWWTTRENRKKRYDLLHIHNMPDFLVYAGWSARASGARVILDIHDIVPEFYSNKFRGGRESFTTALLKTVERWSASFADHVIVSNHLWLEKYRSRTGAAGKSSVFINNVDTNIFQPRPRTRSDDRLIVIFPGGLQWHQGLDIALAAFKNVRSEVPNAEFHIYGDGNMKPALIKLAGDLGLNGAVKFFDPVGVRQISRIMSEADMGVVPKRADSFGNEAYSTKIMEFMSLGVPVVVSRTKIDQYYFSDATVRFFESGNAAELAQAMIEVLKDQVLRKRLVNNALAYSAENSWARRKEDYLNLVDTLIFSSDRRS